MPEETTPMCNQPPATSINDIQFGRVFRFGTLLKAIGTAISPSRIGIAMFTLALLVGGGRTWDALVFVDNPDAATSIAAPFESSIEWIGTSGDELVAATTTANPRHFLDASQQLLWGTTARLWNDGHFWFLVLFGTWTAAVMAFGGGLLCRLEAVHIATGDPPPLNPALAMSIERWVAFFGALMVPFVLIALISLGLLVFGFVLFNVAILDILGGIGYGLALLLGLGVTLLLLGFVVACPLLLPAVATENCDGPDAMHRAVAYVLSKPLTWMLYLFTMLLGLSLGLILVGGVAALTLTITETLVGGWVTGNTFEVAAAAMSQSDTAEGSWSTQWSAGLIAFWSSLMQWVVAGWAIAYIMGASTRAYLLLRYTIDGQDEAAIWWPGLIRGTLAPSPHSAD
jgi:hypothetical protein